MTLASYNNFHNNVFKDTFVITLTNAGRSTALLSSMVEDVFFKCSLWNHQNYPPPSLPPPQLLSGTSLFAGFAIFSILGHMANFYKMPIGEVVKEGQTEASNLQR